jgi:hypothetical protein
MVAVSEQQLEAELVAGRVGCLGCGGRLSPWGLARGADAGGRALGAAATGVLWQLRDHARALPGVERSAPARWLGGDRRSAMSGCGGAPAPRDRPPGTVRGWLRAARSRSDLLRCSGARWAYALDPELGRVEPRQLDAGRRDRGPRVDASVRQPGRRWVERAVWLTGGLLHGLPPPPR